MERELKQRTYDTEALDKMLTVIELYDKKYDDRAVAIAEDMYSRGYSDVFKNIADYYYQKANTKDDLFKKAFFWYLKAFKKQPDEQAASNLSSAYYFGIGVDVDYKKSFEILSEIENLNKGFSNLMMARMHHYSHGVAKDFKKAEYHYKESIRLGNKIALNEYSAFLRKDKGQFIKGGWLYLKSVAEILFISIYEKLKYGHISSDKLKGA